MNRKKLVYLTSIILAVILSCSILGCTPNQKPDGSSKGSEQPSAEDRYKRGHNIPGKLYWAGSSQDKMVALTFDDGPEEYWTPKILDILKEKDVKATFFVIGKQVQKNPNMLKRIFAEGHVIGNHTFDHADLTKLDAQQVYQEIENGALEIHKVIGKTPQFVRPPFGFHNKTVDDIVYSKNRIIVLWSLDTEDWTGVDTATIKSRIIPKMQNGYIILQHDGENPKLGGSIQALPDIIDELKARGYTFVTVAELLNVQPY